MTRKSFKKLFQAARETETFKAEKVILDFTSDLYQLMNRQGLTKTELSRRLGMSQAYITKVFRGNVNFTIETMVKLSGALGGSVHIHVAETEVDVQWFGLAHGTEIHGTTAVEKDTESVHLEENYAAPTVAA